MIKKIGVLTGGGDCPGLNAVLRAVVKTSIMKYGYEVIGFKDGYRGLVLNQFKKLGMEESSGILDKGGTILGTSNKDNPFNFKIKNAEGTYEYKDMSDRVLENIKMHNVDAMIIIGGDGTLAGAYELHKKGLKVIGIPKTIDNDLSGTDLTFGFLTAVETATHAIDKLHSTAESHHRVMILEVMGRNAGWIALESGIAGGADVILIPEIPYDINKVVHKIIERKQNGKSFSIVVVAEGARPVGGSVIVKRIIEDSPDPVRLGGIGNKIGEDIENMTGLETRVTVLGYLQRGGRPCPADRILSTRFGVKAVDMVNTENFGEMVCLEGNVISSVTIKDAVGILKTVDTKGEMVEIAKSIKLELGENA